MQRCADISRFLYFGGWQVCLWTPVTQGSWFKKIPVSTRSILGKRLHEKLLEIVPKVKRFLFHQKPFILWKLKKQFAENNSWTVHLSGPYRKIRTAKETNQNSPFHRDQLRSHIINFSQVTNKARDFPWAFIVFYHSCMLVQNKITNFVILWHSMTRVWFHLHQRHNLLNLLHALHLKRTKNSTLKLGLMEVVCTGLILSSTIEIKSKCLAFLFYCSKFLTITVHLVSVNFIFHPGLCWPCSNLWRQQQ